MPSREHRSDRVRVRVSTIHTDILGKYVEWGVEATRERRYTIPAVWWNPFSWGRTEWRREGAPPAFVDVAFLRGDGNRIPDAVLQPTFERRAGYAKFGVAYAFFSYGTGNGLTDLGNDARSVRRITVSYAWENSTFQLRDP